MRIKLSVLLLGVENDRNANSERILYGNARSRSGDDRRPGAVLDGSLPSTAMIPTTCGVGSVRYLPIGMAPQQVIARVP